jgi:hypothetical protein
MLLFIAMLLVPVLAWGQSTGTISGGVGDEKTHAPLVGATVLLRDAADSSAKPLGAVTNAKGEYTIDHLAIGTAYRLEIRYVGYENYERQDIRPTSERPAIAMGTVLLHPKTVEARDVDVTAERSGVSIRADKRVYSVENNTAYTATDVSELLGQIPAVRVDQDGNVSLRGNDNVTIMVDDRPLTMPADQRNKFLKSLPAGMVKDIEVRTTPGAQFDANGTGGIINIVTRRTMSDMVGGNVNMGIDSRSQFNGGGGLFYNGSGLNASIGGGVYHGQGDDSSYNLRLSYLDSSRHRDVTIGGGDWGSTSYYSYGQIDYNITDIDLASLSFNICHWSSHYTSHDIHTYYDVNNAVTMTLHNSTAPDAVIGNDGGYDFASLLLKHSFSKDHTLSLNFSYDANGNVEEHTYIATYYGVRGELDSARGTTRHDWSDRRNSTIITSLDYENPIDEHLKLSLGGKNEINSMDNDLTINNLDRGSGAWVLDTMQTNHYLPKNSIYALYGNVAYTPVERLSLQGGLRLEMANVAARFVNGEPIVSRTYTNLFPSGSIAYSITEEQSLTLGYRRSIALPDIDALNPTTRMWNYIYVMSGNPDLNPEFTQTIDLNYSAFWGAGNMISVAPYYATTDGSIEQSQQVVDSVSYTSYTNFNGSYSLGSNISVAMKPLAWLNFRVSGDLYREVNRGGDRPGDSYSAAWGASSNVSLNADLLEGMTFGLNLYVDRPADVGGVHQSGYTFCSFVLRQRLFDKKLNISLRVNDPFDLRKQESSYDTPTLHTETSSRSTSRFIGLSLSYSFGTTPRMETHNQDRTETKGGSGSGGSGGQGQ